MELRELTNQEFNNFTQVFKDKSIYQTSEYGFVMNNQGFDSILLGLINDGVVIGASLVLVKKVAGFKYAYVPRGFLINYEDFYLVKEFTEKIKEYCNKSGIVAIKINPMIVRNIYDFNNQTMVTNPKYPLIIESLQHNQYYHLGYNNFFEALKPRFEAILDLQPNEITLFQNIKKNFRTKIRSAINYGIKIYKGTVNELPILYEFTKTKYTRDLNYFQDCMGYFTNRQMIDFYYAKLDTEQYLRHTQEIFNKYQALSNRLNQQIINKAKQNPQSLINKKINIDKYLEQYRKELIYATNLLHDYPLGVVISAILLVKQGSTVTILMDGNDENYRKLNAKHLLIWQMMQIYKKQGFTTLNLGGMSNMTVDLDKYIGLNEFKLNFGSKMVEYAGDFELVTHKRNYSLYRTIHQLKNKK